MPSKIHWRERKWARIIIFLKFQSTLDESFKILIKLSSVKKMTNYDSQSFPLIDFDTFLNLGLC